VETVHIQEVTLAKLPVLGLFSSAG